MRKKRFIVFEFPEERESDFQEFLIDVIVPRLIDEFFDVTLPDKDTLIRVVEEEVKRYGDINVTPFKTCDICNGTGEVSTDETTITCGSCGGKGFKKK